MKKKRFEKRTKRVIEQMCRDHKKKTENKKDVMCSDLPRICIWFRAGNYTKKEPFLSLERKDLRITRIDANS